MKKFFIIIVYFFTIHIFTDIWAVVGALSSRLPNNESQLCKEGGSKHKDSSPNELNNLQSILSEKLSSDIAQEMLSCLLKLQNLRKNVRKKLRFSEENSLLLCLYRFAFGLVTKNTKLDYRALGPLVFFDWLIDNGYQIEHKSLVELLYHNRKKLIELGEDEQDLILKINSFLDQAEALLDETLLGKESLDDFRETVAEKLSSDIAQEMLSCLLELQNLKEKTGRNLRFPEERNLLFYLYRFALGPVTKNTKLGFKVFGPKVFFDWLTGNGYNIEYKSLVGLLHYNRKKLIELGEDEQGFILKMNSLLKQAKALLDKLLLDKGNDNKKDSSFTEIEVLKLGRFDLDSNSLDDRNNSNSSDESSSLVDENDNIFDGAFDLAALSDEIREFRGRPYDAVNTFYDDDDLLDIDNVDKNAFGNSKEDVLFINLFKRIFFSPINLKTILPKIEEEFDKENSSNSNTYKKFFSILHGHKIEDLERMQEEAGLKKQRSNQDCFKENELKGMAKLFLKIFGGISLFTNDMVVDVLKTFSSDIASY